MNGFSILSRMLLVFLGLVIGIPLLMYLIPLLMYLKGVVPVMIGLYFVVALWMFLVFFGLVIGIPLLMYVKCVIDDAINDTSSSWDENPWLTILDEFYNGIDAYYIGERVIASIAIVVVLSLFWVVGVFVVGYVISKISKKIKEDKYNDMIKRHSDY